MSEFLSLIIRNPSSGSESARHWTVLGISIGITTVVALGVVTG